MGLHLISGHLPTIAPGVAWYYGRERYTYNHYLEKVNITPTTFIPQRRFRYQCRCWEFEIGNPKFWILNGELAMGMRNEDAGIVVSAKGNSLDSENMPSLLVLHRNMAKLDYIWSIHIGLESKHFKSFNLMLGTLQNRQPTDTNSQGF